MRYISGIQKRDESNLAKLLFYGADYCADYSVILSLLTDRVP